MQYLGFLSHVLHYMKNISGLVQESNSGKYIHEGAVVACGPFFEFVYINEFIKTLFSPMIVAKQPTFGDVITGWG